MLSQSLCVIITIKLIVSDTSRQLKAVGTLINQQIWKEPLTLRINTGPPKVGKKKDPLQKITQKPAKLLIHNTVTVEQAKRNRIIPRCPDRPDHLRRGPTTPCDPCKKETTIKKDPCGRLPSKEICAAYFPAGARKKTCTSRNPCGPKKDKCPKSDPCGPRKDPCAPKKKNPCEECPPKKCEPCPPPPPKKEVCDPCKPCKKDPCG